MNYSDYDSDGYSSNEDADYVPSDDNLSEDDINECLKEDPLYADDVVPHPDDVSKTKRKKKAISMRKRKKGVLKIEMEGRDGGEAQESHPAQEEMVKPRGEGDVAEEKLKKKSDDLWVRFLSDVGSRPKQSTDNAQSSTIQKADSPTMKTALLTTETTASEPAKVTITKVFDFAGEEVRVNKVVSANSREGKSYLKSQNAEPEENGEEDTNSSPGQQPLPGTSAKRPASMSSLLSRIGGKKQKMSTLEKSKMDWDAFKSEEGITEELAIHNRGREGFVERKNFLERVDHRQFELEKAVRLSNKKQ
ncbi:craniofacial development protein 1 [Hippoglossus stenolepis]|uniref:craniofacial development protein 1 n=1 Tax=Hippoglossus stenolepis TaxID=195615 RepID=UPI00159C57B0|nr:craniofacial development protein 1 [Hippoglossus stenolepis]